MNVFYAPSFLRSRMRSPLRQKPTSFWLRIMLLAMSWIRRTPRRKVSAAIGSRPRLQCESPMWSIFVSKSSKSLKLNWLKPADTLNDRMVRYVTWYWGDYSTCGYWHNKCIQYILNDVLWLERCRKRWKCLNWSIKYSNDGDGNLMVLLYRNTGFNCRTTESVRLFPVH